MNLLSNNKTLILGVLTGVVMLIGGIVAWNVFSDKDITKVEQIIVKKEAIDKDEEKFTEHTLVRCLKSFDNKYKFIIIGAGKGKNTNVNNDLAKTCLDNSKYLPYSVPFIKYEVDLLGKTIEDSKWYEAGSADTDANIWGDPIAWFNDDSIVVRQEWVASGSSLGVSSKSYEIYNFKTKKVVKKLWEYNIRSSLITEIIIDPIITINFLDSKYFFDQRQNGKIIIYSIKEDGIFFVANENKDNSSIVDSIAILDSALQKQAKLEIPENAEFKIDTADYTGIFFFVGDKRYQFSPDLKNIIEV